MTITNWHGLANPARFRRFAARVKPFCAATSIVLFAAGIYDALYASPPDYQQGDTVRIMYVHVPAAWLAMSHLRLDGACLGGGVRLAASPGRPLYQGGRSDRRYLHRDLSCHRQFLGPADVGRVVGVGRAPDLGP